MESGQRWIEGTGKMIPEQGLDEEGKMDIHVVTEA